MARQVFKVLVVEDEKIIRDNIIQKINSCNPSFIVVADSTNGTSAIEIIESQKIDVLFTDIRMPIMDGLELAKNVREKYPHIQVVIISGYAEFSYAQSAIRLGIEDYLLKPIKTELLTQILQKIETKLISDYNQKKYELILNAINGNERSNCEGTTEKFTVFLLNMGNYCSTMPSFEICRYYEEVWKRIDFSFLGKLCGDYWLVNSSRCNSKYIVLPETNPCASLAQSIFDTLIQQSMPVSVNLFYGSPVNLDELYDHVNALSLSLSQYLIMNESSIINIDNYVPILTSTSLDASVYRKLESLIAQEQIKAIQQVVQSLLTSVFTSEYPQKWIEDYIDQIIKLFQRHSVSTSKAEFFHSEYELFSKFSIPIDINAIINQVWNILLPMLNDKSKDTVTSHELIDAVRNFIAENYNNNNITLEGIARRFDFTPSYLIRVFKKYVGETPIQYTINLRMNEAKRLMISCPELDIKQISEIVGYADQHYFSRIFKNVHDVSPTQFRNSIR